MKNEQKKELKKYKESVFRVIERRGKLQTKELKNGTLKNGSYAMRRNNSFYFKLDEHEDSTRHLICFFVHLMLLLVVH